MSRPRTCSTPRLATKPGPTLIACSRLSPRPPTGLPNRLLLQARIEHEAGRAERTHADAAILFADLDQFKRVNDTFGHRVGDELLVAVVERLRA